MATFLGEPGAPVTARLTFAASYYLLCWQLSGMVLEVTVCPG